ncbi:MAG: cytochrome c, partial [Pseudomonadota bacterium]
QHYGRIGPVVKGEQPYDKGEVAKNAAIAEQMSKLPWDGFVAGTDKGATDAKPEIWTDAAKFKSAAEKMEKELSKLAQVAKGGDLNAVKAQFGETSKACKSCHDDFRKKK